MSSEYLVEVLMCAYNHEAYIAQAIEGVLSQQTSFRYRLVIGEDCSPDGTREIVRSYAERFPDRVTAILHPHNLGVNENARILFNTCKARYIALCDGDDYWTHPGKLQQQFDYLEAHPDVSIYLHNAQLIRGGRETGLKNSEAEEHYYVMRDALIRKVLGPTSSYFYRNPVVYPKWFSTVYGGDAALLVLLANKGRIYYHPAVMSAYRLHETSLERTYDSRSLEKALRDNQQYNAYMDAGEVVGKDRIVLYKKMSWNHFYRVMKGASMMRFGTVFPDLYNSFRYLAKAFRVSIL